ncbi:MAG: metal ABC transporter solute-binding protein, Zn/Mn family [Bdellovibrionales bacterium]
MKSVLLALLLAVVSGAAPALAQEPVKVVASFSILGNLVQEIGGDEVRVDTLVGPNEDAHDFQPAPNDARRLKDADIIAINGLRFEGWIGRMIKASGTKAKLLVASAGVRPRILEKDDGHHHHSHHDLEEGETPVDPHAWQDLRNGKMYVSNIAKALIEARPEKVGLFKQRAKALMEELDALDSKAREGFDKLEPERRTVMTTHEAFGYFGDAYGLQFVSPIGINTEAQPSAADLAKLEEQIEAHHIQALFIENMTDPRMIHQVAKDTGAHIGGKLYADALSGPDGEAPTYLDMMRVNIGRVEAALRE